jgi:hypothetical protein
MAGENLVYDTTAMAVSCAIKRKTYFLNPVYYHRLTKVRTSGMVEDTQV